MSLYTEMLRFAEAEGFNSCESFLCFYVQQGYRLIDFKQHIAYVHRWHASYPAFHKTFGDILRKAVKIRKRKIRKIKNRKLSFAEHEGFKSLTASEEWRKHLRELGFRSIDHALSVLRSQRKSFKQISQILGISYQNLMKKKRGHHDEPRR